MSVSKMMEDVNFDPEGRSTIAHSDSSLGRKEYPTPIRPVGTAECSFLREAMP
jgi:hypothetical protein